MERFIDATEDPELLALSPALAETIAQTAAAGGPSTWLVRRQRPYLLLGPQDRRLPHLDDAIAFCRARGLAVHMRVGGGAAVLLDEGCLSFAAAVACRDIGRLEENFQRYTAPLRRALERLGAPVAFGRAPGAYCEGPQDLVCGGRKLVGVAQALRRGYALVSGMVMVSQDAQATTAFLQEFYDRAGGGRRLRAAAVTSLRELLGDRADWRALVAEMRAEAAADGWSAAPGRLDERERAAARSLLASRRADASPAACAASGDSAE